MSDEIVPADLTGSDVALRQNLLAPDHGDAQEPPQWVIMGINLHGRVAVLASSTLTKAEMRRRVETVIKKAPFSARPLYLGKETTAVGFLCDGFTMIYGDTYAAAMASLAEVWQPPELEEGHD